jgi:uncharacterized membrane protein (Fun14 family)
VIDLYWLPIMVGALAGIALGLLLRVRIVLALVGAFTLGFVALYLFDVKRYDDCEQCPPAKDALEWAGGLLYYAAATLLVTAIFRAAWLDRRRKTSMGER